MRFIHTQNGVFEDLHMEFLQYIKGNADLTLPDRITPDIENGIEFALSHLEPIEQQLLKLRRYSSLALSQIATRLSLSVTQAEALETSACKKLRQFHLWNYMLYGIVGYVKKTAADEYARGYSLGYQAGYKTAVIDINNGTHRQYASNELLNTPVTSLQFSARIRHSLRIANIKCLGELIALDDSQIRALRKLGPVSTNEIAKKIKALNIQHTSWDKYLL